MQAEVRTCLTQAIGGDLAANRQLSETLYGELRALAGRYFGQAPVAALTLQPTAIVNEALLRLLGPKQVDEKSRTHFFAAAAVAMRCVLVDHARASATQKRGGDLGRVTLDTGDAAVSDDFVDAVMLHDLLDRLAQMSDRAAKVVEMRLFAGMTIAEAATALDVSEGTVKGDWRMARAWLRAELNERHEP